MLTTKGKVAVGVLVLFLFGVIFMIAKPSAPVVDPLDSPATAPAGFHFPFRSIQERDAFSKQSLQTAANLDYCQIYNGYAENRGVPIEFDALIPKDARQSPYYIKNPETGTEYLPAVLVPRTGNGLEAAQAAALNATSDPSQIGGLGECAGATGGKVILAFGKSIPPTTDLVHVKGYIWWSTSGYSSAAGMQQPDTPIVIVGEQEPQTASQIARPAYRIRNLNVALKSKDVIVRLSRVEWATEETRVWAEVINLRGTVAPSWPGISSMTMREQGKGEMVPGTDTAGSVDEQRSEFDDFIPTDNTPPKGTGTLKGYLVFPRTDPTKRIYLTMPDPNPDDESENPPVTVKLPPELNLDPMDGSK